MAAKLISDRSESISNFVSRLLRPSMTEIDDGESLASFETADEVVFIGYFDPKDEVARQGFAAVADKYRNDFTFGLVTSDALIAAQKLEPPVVVCHVVQDGESRTWNSFSDPDDLDRFVREASRPAIGELMPHNRQLLIDRGWPMVYIFGATEADRAELRSSLRKFAKSQYESLTCVTVDPLEFPHLQAEMGLEPGVFPSGAVHQLSKDRIYPYPRGQPLDTRSLQKWGLDVWQGRIQPWTPPGATTVHEERAGPTKSVKRKLSVANIPGVNIRVGGRDEL
ncbi:hypothetical protein M406DRAFT_286705 [Cryphonectria parasitica EP155]|uniref:Uncharacterized protein n=1 Tax=Cryphonectria parasitica (strain ATCC 38755 / EP155) TaxID=660469 RepID=A0A9P4Y917_CRYP1|nr:uncharacterized protein M406DRAFT_286705 [Cryphonectria parasitica EP155]KAF3768731.1 hypothetical protein M406DRAFT_286705 [Cryphonectria parasitica EP155]